MSFKFNKQKLLGYSILLLFMVIILVSTSCTMPSKELSPENSIENAKEVTLEGIVLPNQTIFITKSKSSNRLKDELISIHMKDDSKLKNPGSLVKYTIKSEIKESYPMQATGVSATVLEDTASVIKAPIDAGIKIIDHMPDDVYLIDVRTANEFNSGHIEGSINLPVDDLERLIAKEVPDKDKVILLYCRSGSRSATAAKVLKGLDYTIVFDLGGINSYQGQLAS